MNQPPRVETSCKQQAPLRESLRANQSHTLRGTHVHNQPWLKEPLSCTIKSSASRKSRYYRVCEPTVISCSLSRPNTIDSDSRDQPSPRCHLQAEGFAARYFKNPPITHASRRIRSQSTPTSRIILPVPLKSPASRRLRYYEEFEPIKLSLPKEKLQSNIHALRVSNSRCTISCKQMILKRELSGQQADAHPKIPFNLTTTT